MTPKDAVALWVFMQEWESALADWEQKAYERLVYLRQGGATWRWIGEALDITPQAAQQRFKRYEDAFYAYVDERVRRHETGEDDEDAPVENGPSYWDWRSEQEAKVVARIEALMARRERD